MSSCSKELVIALLTSAPSLIRLSIFCSRASIQNVISLFLTLVVISPAHCAARDIGTGIAADSLSVATTTEPRSKSRTEFADRQQLRSCSPPDGLICSQSSYSPAANCDTTYRFEDLTLLSKSSSLTSCDSGGSSGGAGRTCSRRPAVIADAPTASSYHPALTNYNNKQAAADYDSSKYRDPDLVSFLRRRLLIMRLKERVMILLIAACCVLCVLFVIQSRISDDVIWEYPKKYK